MWVVEVRLAHQGGGETAGPVGVRATVVLVLSLNGVKSKFTPVAWGVLAGEQRLPGEALHSGELA